MLSARVKLLRLEVRWVAVQSVPRYPGEAAQSCAKAMVGVVRTWLCPLMY